jgi:hypothetical protein
MDGIASPGLAFSVANDAENVAIETQPRERNTARENARGWKGLKSIAIPTNPMAQMYFSERTACRATRVAPAQTTN